MTPTDQERQALEGGWKRVVNVSGPSESCGEGSPQRAAAKIARDTHSMRKARPPTGVTAPSTETPLRASAHKLPENSKMPATDDQPAIASSRASPMRPDCGRDKEQGEHVVHLIANRGFEYIEHFWRQAATQAVRPEGAGRHPDETEDRSNEEERCVHLSHPRTKRLSATVGFVHASAGGGRRSFPQRLEEATGPNEPGTPPGRRIR